MIKLSSPVSRYRCRKKLRQSNAFSGKGKRRSSGRSGLEAGYQALEAKCLLAGVVYQSPVVVVTMDHVVGEFAGTTFAEDPTIIDLNATLEDPNNPDPPDYDGPVRAIQDKAGNILYPIDSEFGFYVEDFVGADQKVRDGLYTEGWVGNITDETGEVIGLSIANAVTDTFLTPARLGTWLAGLGGNSIKASTEHYVVMQGVLSDQEYPGDPNALYPLDDNLIIIGGPDDGREMQVVIDERQAIYDGGDTSVDVFPFATDTTPAGDGVIDIRDILSPNETTIDENIAASTDYSVTLKDDGKLLYRWGNMIKKPNDIRMTVPVDVPDSWKDPSAALINGGLGYRVVSAELMVTHAITNNPNDQIRPEDLENEAATGRKPSYVVIEHPDFPGDPDYALWVSPVDDFTGDGTYLPSYFELDENGDVILDSNGEPIVRVDDMGNPIGTILREIRPDGWESSTLVSSDLTGGYTEAWYTSMDRDPFEAVLDQNGEYIVGPRWRLLSNKFGQDLPGVEIPAIPHSEPPFQKDNIKYPVGDLTTTTINLLDWAAGEDSPLLYSGGWTAADGVTINGLVLSELLDVGLYVKGDAKPTEIYGLQVILTYEYESVLTVENTNDSGPGSLRDAIETANMLPGVQLIDFAIPGTGVQTISPLSPLPAITDAVAIDATTQTDYMGTPLIELSGALAGSDANGLLIMADGTQISGFAINQFGSDGIEVFGADGVIISDNVIGTDASGTMDLGNGAFGVHLINTGHSTVSGNLLSGNDHSGIALRGATTVENVVVDNLIGTSGDSLSSIGNQYHGIVLVAGATGNQIGDLGDGSGNVISGNGSNGVLLSGDSALGNRLLGNRVGTDLAGAIDVGNGNYGIHITSSSANHVEQNLVSGNVSGIVLRGVATTANEIVGNWIGTDADGLTAVANSGFGIIVTQGAHNNLIGGDSESSRNLISGNGHSGIIVDTAGTTSNVIVGNWIGVDETGMASLPNSVHGVIVSAGAAGNRIGGLAEGEANVISGNAKVGLLLNPNTSTTEVLGNRLGTDSGATMAIPNGTYGIHVNASSDNQIESNVVSANGNAGVVLRGSSATGNQVSGNRIGTDGQGNANLGNRGDGVLLIDGASDNVIGGTAAGAGNTIAFNGRNGVTVLDGCINDAILQNEIFENLSLGIDLNGDGLTANDVADPDTGGNRLQNYADLNSIVRQASGALAIWYNVDSDAANATYPMRVEFFRAVGNGQGKFFLGADTFTEADWLNGSKTILLDPLQDIMVGDRIVVTVTDDDGNTSEFSEVLEVI